MIVEAQITINASKAAVWAATTDIEHFAQLLSGVEQIEVVQKTANGLVGVKWKETRILFGKPATVEKWITEAKENEFYTTRAEDSGFVFVTTNRLAGSDGSVTLTGIHETQPQGFAAKLKSLPMVFFKGVIKKAILQDLNDIKKAVERIRRTSNDSIVPKSRAFTERLAAVDWSSFDTAYGPATNVSDQLLRLSSPDKSIARQASHDLWCGLCHQHVQVGTAALPALPFLLEVMEIADDQLVVEILDIVLGLAKGVNRREYESFQRSEGREPRPDPEWIIELRGLLLKEDDRFNALSTHSNSEIGEFASAVLQELHVEKD